MILGDTAHGRGAVGVRVDAELVLHELLDQNESSVGRRAVVRPAKLRAILHLRNATLPAAA
jgi:hypothetical protein